MRGLLAWGVFCLLVGMLLGEGTTARRAKAMMALLSLSLGIGLLLRMGTG